MRWLDIDQSPEATRREGGASIRTSSILELFPISFSREIGEVTINMIVLVVSHSLSNGAYVVVSPITVLISMNE